MRMIKIYFEQYVENTAPGTESPDILCAGIGSLQIGIVVVCLTFVWKLIYWRQQRMQSQTTNNQL